MSKRKNTPYGNKMSNSLLDINSYNQNFMYKHGGMKNKYMFGGLASGLAKSLGANDDIANVAGLAGSGLGMLVNPMSGMQGLPYAMDLAGMGNPKNTFNYGGATNMYNDGGQLMSMQGPSHEQGGINIGNNNEVEGGEVMTKDFVFTDEFGPKGKNGLTYAKLADKIRKKQELRPGDSITKESTEREIQALIQQHESDPNILKAREKQQAQQFKYGGRKYKEGGPLSNAFWESTLGNPVFPTSDAYNTNQVQLGQILDNTGGNMTLQGSEVINQNNSILNSSRNPKSYNDVAIPGLLPEAFIYSDTNADSGIENNFPRTNSIYDNTLRNIEKQSKSTIAQIPSNLRSMGYTPNEEIEALEGYNRAERGDFSPGRNVPRTKRNDYTFTPSATSNNMQSPNFQGDFPYTDAESGKVMNAPQDFFNSTPQQYNNSLESVAPNKWGYAANAIGPLAQGLYAGLTPAENTKYDRVRPERLDMFPARQELQRQGSLANANLRRAAGNQRTIGANMAQTTAGNVGINKNIGSGMLQSYGQERMFNAQANQQANMFNAQTQRAERDANDANRASRRNMIFGAVGDLGTGLAGGISENNAFQAQELMNRRGLNMANSMYTNYFMNPNGTIQYRR